jgi:hypothetical protein
MLVFSSKFDVEVRAAKLDQADVYQCTTPWREQMNRVVLAAKMFLTAVTRPKRAIAPRTMAPAIPL